MEGHGVPLYPPLHSARLSAGRGGQGGQAMRGAAQAGGQLEDSGSALTSSGHFATPAEWETPSKEGGQPQREGVRSQSSGRVEESRRPQPHPCSPERLGTASGTPPQMRSTPLWARQLSTGL